MVAFINNRVTNEDVKCSTFLNLHDNLSFNDDITGIQAITGLMDGSDTTKETKHKMSIRA